MIKRSFEGREAVRLCQSGYYLGHHLVTWSPRKELYGSPKWLSLIDLFTAYPCFLYGDLADLLCRYRENVVVQYNE